MMLDIDFAELRAGFVRYLPLGALVAIILAAELVFAVGAWSAGGIDLANRAAPIAQGTSNIQQIGELLYTRYIFLRSEEHTSELQSLMRISYAVFCLNKQTNKQSTKINTNTVNNKPVIRKPPIHPHNNKHMTQSTHKIN